MMFKATYLNFLDVKKLVVWKKVVLIEEEEENIKSILAVVKEICRFIKFIHFNGIETRKVQGCSGEEYCYTLTAYIAEVGLAYHIISYHKLSRIGRL